jgi:hypothetical protein
MKKLAIVSLLLFTLVVGLAAGAWLGAKFESQVCLRLINAQPDTDMAFMTAREAEWLAELRLNEATNAIADLENTLNVQVATLAAWDEIAPPDDSVRKARDRWLVPVKVYRKSYPASGQDAALANKLLSTVPDRNPKSVCKSGVCRLDDLRLSKLGIFTNSPFDVPK